LVLPVKNEEAENFAGLYSAMKMHIIPMQTKAPYNHTVSQSTPFETDLWV
jgi:hypothetical protein